MAFSLWYLDAEVIYGLASPDGAVRYVGKTRRPTDRFLQHKKAKSLLGEWVRNSDVTMIALELCKIGEIYSGDRERYWISHYRSSGSKMFNIYPLERAA